MSQQNQPSPETTVHSSQHTSDDSCKEIIDAVTSFTDKIGTINTETPEIQQWCDNRGLPTEQNTESILKTHAAITAFLRFALIDFEQQSPDSQARSVTAYDSVADTDTYGAVVTASREHDVVTSVPDVLPVETALTDTPVHEFSELRKAVRQLATVDNPFDVLGACYESLLPQDTRWYEGQFHTPEELATFMGTVIGNANPSRILDPGIGAGMLTHATNRTTTNAEIHGIERNPISLLLVITALLYDNTPEENTSGNTVSLHEYDFFNCDAETIGTFDAVITNPPYTKHQQLTATDKTRIQRTVDAAFDSEYDVSKLAPLYTYFSMYTTAFLEQDATAVFLLPAEALNTDYGIVWKQFLLDQFDITALIRISPNTESVFDNVETTSLIIIGSYTGSDDVTSTDSNVSFIEIDNTDSIVQFTELLQRTGNPVGETIDTLTENIEQYIDPVHYDRVPQPSLSPQTPWSQYFTADAVISTNNDALITFGEIVTISRGIGTGQNSFFCLSENDRVNTTGTHTWDIPTTVLTPIVRRATHIPHYTFTTHDWEKLRESGEKTWLLYHVTELDATIDTGTHHTDETVAAQAPLTEFTSNNVEPPDPDSEQTDAALSESTRKAVLAYLQYGMQLDDPPNETYLATHRSPWYVVERQTPPDILYTSMNRGSGRFIYNKANVRHLNNLHGITLTIDLTDDELKSLLAYLNTSLVDTYLMHTGRTLSSGMRKIEPGDITTLPVIDPRSLPADTVKELASAFDTLCNASRTETMDVTQTITQIEAILEHRIGINPA